MNDFKSENRGEKWVISIVQSLAEDKWGKHLPFLFVACAALLGYLSVQTKSTIAITATVANLLIALIYFERWHFSRIIKRQQAQIDGLSKQLNAITSTK